ncbi:hypothetical protein E5329_08965 [Petralouisia muris]|uniref:Uncharacterized protein n=1 Tax=Petralouisia muris TaxID=3032872 RepID=A0AC61RY66_9FIRM|nr:DUF6715 family protein [Petralouisia muris]TGY96681.1 hypothetical protein E5329_08965 [Petralouisia muris]
MKKNGVKSAIIVIVCAALCLGYYYYLTQRDSGKETGLSEVEMIISKDLEKSYPKTAREVVKFYNRILECYYSEDYTQEQLEKMTEQARILMDEELKEINPQDLYLEAVKADISSYKDDKKMISNVTVEGSKEVEYKTKNGRDCAYVDVSYFLKSNNKNEKSGRVSQTYILRKDEDSNWRILGFYQE